MSFRSRLNIGHKLIKDLGYNSLQCAKFLLVNIRFFSGRTKIIKGENVRMYGSDIDVVGGLTIAINGLNNLFEYEKTIIENYGNIHIEGHSDIGKGLKIFVGVNAKIVIGSNTFFTGSSILHSNNSIFIGSNCAISWGVQIIDSDFHHIEGGINYGAITIGDNCWIGSKVTILKGVKLPDNTVVASGSVVVKSFNEPNLMIGGIPAQVLKTGVNWER